MNCLSAVRLLVSGLSAILLMCGAALAGNEDAESRMYFSTYAGNVYLADTAAGTVVKVANVKRTVRDIASCPGGALYFLSEGVLYSLNIKKGTTKRLGYTGDYYTDNMTCGGDGILYGSISDEVYLYRISRDNGALFTVMTMKDFIYGGALASLNKKSLYVINYVTKRGDVFANLNVNKKTMATPVKIKGDNPSDFSGATFLGKTLYVSHDFGIYTLDRKTGVSTLWYKHPYKVNENITGVAVVR